MSPLCAQSPPVWSPAPRRHSPDGHRCGVGRGKRCGEGDWGVTRACGGSSVSVMPPVADPPILDSVSPCPAQAVFVKHPPSAHPRGPWLPLSSAGPGGPGEKGGGRRGSAIRARRPWGHRWGGWTLSRAVTGGEGGVAGLWGGEEAAVFEKGQKN